MRLAVVGQTHQTRLHRFAPPTGTEITQRVPLEVRKWGELTWGRPRLRVTYVGYVTSEYGPRSEGRLALRATIHAEVVRMVPVDLNALQTEGVSTRDGDGVLLGVCAEWAGVVQVFRFCHFLKESCEKDR